MSSNVRRHDLKWRTPNPCQTCNPQSSSNLLSTGVTWMISRYSSQKAGKRVLWVCEFPGYEFGLSSLQLFCISFDWWLCYGHDTKIMSCLYELPKTLHMNVDILELVI